MSAKRMSIKQYLQIGKWLDEHKMNIQAKKWSQPETQTIISSTLGYEVPLSTVISCAKALDIVWARSPAKPPPVPIDHEAIVILIGAISGLYIETGKTVPDNLANLQSTYAREGI